MKDTEFENDIEIKTGSEIQNDSGYREEKHEFPAPVDEKQQTEDLKKTALMWETLKKDKKDDTQAYYFAWHMELLTKKKMGLTIPVPEELKEYRNQNGLDEWGETPAEAHGYTSEDNISLPESKKTTMQEREYELHSFNRIDLKKNADNIKRVYDLLDSKDHWYMGGSSPEFRALMEELKTLKKLAAKVESNRKKLLAERDSGKIPGLRKKEKETLNAYLRSSREFDRRAKEYLDNKKGNINSTYAQERFDAVSDARRICALNRASVEDTYRRESVKRIERRRTPEITNAYVRSEKEKYLNWLNNVYDKYSLSLGKVDNRKVYYGQRYTDQGLNESSNPYGLSIGRTAAHSITTIALMAKKDEKTGEYLYTAEDIMDPSKLQKEKQDIFREVVERANKKDPENGKWLAETMHTGYMAAIQRTGDMLRGVNFSDPDYIFDPDFSKAAMLGVTLMDVWQEMNKIPDEMLEAAKKDFPDLKNAQEYHDITGTMRGYLDQFSVNIHSVAEGIRYIDNKFSDTAASAVFSNSLVVGNLRKLFAKKAVECRDKPFQEWFNYEEGALGRSFYIGALAQFNNSMFSSKEDFEYKLPAMLDGTMYANIRYNFDPKAPEKFRYIGTFDKNLIREDYEFSKLSETEVLKRINTRIDHYEALKKTSAPTMQQYLSGAIRGITTLSLSYGGDSAMSEEGKQAVRAAVKDIFAYQLATVFKRYGANDDELKGLIDRHLEKVPAYQKHMDYVGIGTLKGLMTGDVTDQIEDCEEIYLAQCRLVRRKLENGVYQKEDQMEQAFAMAYTAALYDRVGKLPDKPSNNPEPFEPREFTEAYMTSWEKHPRHRDQIMTMIMHPEMATKMLNDTEGLKRYVDKSDAKVRAWRMKEDEKVRIRNEKRAKASKQLEERRRLKNPGKT